MMVGFASANRGFTLLEILVAFVILVMSLSVLFRIFSGGLLNLTLSEQYNNALLLAESQIVVAKSNQQFSQIEVFGETESGMQWVRRIEPYIPWEEEQVLAVPLRAYKVSVEVSWKNAGRRRQVTLSTVLLAGG
jgi:general secretion pathway protein I